MGRGHSQRNDLIHNAEEFALLLQNLLLLLPGTDGETWESPSHST